MLYKLIHFHYNYNYNTDVIKKYDENIKNITENLYLEFTKLINIQENYFTNKDYSNAIEITKNLIKFPYSELKNEKINFKKYKRFFYYNLVQYYSLLEDENSSLEYLELFIKSLDYNENDPCIIKFILENNKNLNIIKNNLKYKLILSVY